MCEVRHHCQPFQRCRVQVGQAGIFCARGRSSKLLSFRSNQLLIRKRANFMWKGKTNQTQHQTTPGKRPLANFECETGEKSKLSHALRWSLGRSSQHCFTKAHLHRSLLIDTSRTSGRLFRYAPDFVPCHSTRIEILNACPLCPNHLQANPMSMRSTVLGLLNPIA